MAAPLHPDIVLHQDVGSSVSVASSLHPSALALNDFSACEHYAGDEKKLRKALALQDELQGAFDVTADLEDGAPSGAEDQTAALLSSILAEPRASTWRVGCRVHPVDHPAFEPDVRHLLSAKPKGLAYITIPKIAGRTQLDTAAAFIIACAKEHGVAPVPWLQVLIEDEGAVHEAHRIAAHPQIAFIAFGQMDFVSSHQGAIGAMAMKSPGQFDHPLLRRAKLEISAACHAFGKIPTHNPTTDYASSRQALDDAGRARHEFGFRRMWSIHPTQVRQILKAFSPSLEELEDASRILLAAQAADWGPIADQGLLHDRASYRYFWALLKRARLTGGVIPQAARQAFF